MPTKEDNPAQPLSDAGRRTILGVLAAILLAVGGLQIFFDPWEGKAEGLGAVCIRVGVMLFTVWLAYPELRRIPSWLFSSVLGGGVVIACRPKLAFVVVPALLLLYGLRALLK